MRCACFPARIQSPACSESRRRPHCLRDTLRSGACVHNSVAADVCSHARYVGQGATDNECASNHCKCCTVRTCMAWHGVAWLGAGSNTRTDTDIHAPTLGREASVNEAGGRGGPPSGTLPATAGLRDAMRVWRVGTQIPPSPSPCAPPGRMGERIWFAALQPLSAKGHG